MLCRPFSLKYPLQNDSREKADKKLADKHAPQIALNTENRDGPEDTDDPQQEADGIDKKGQGGFPQSVDHTNKRTVHIKKRTDPGQGYDEISSQKAVKQQQADKPAEQKKKKTAGQPKGETGLEDFGKKFSYPSGRSSCLKLGNSRHQHDRDRICNGGREENAGQCHSGKHAIYAESLRGTMAVQFQTSRNRNSFDSMKQVDQYPIGGQRKRKGEKGMGNSAQRAERGKRMEEINPLSLKSPDGVKRGEYFSGYNAGGGDGNVGVFSAVCKIEIHKHYAEYPADLFNQLRYSRDLRLLQAVAVADDTAVQGGKRKRIRENQKQHLAACIAENNPADIRNVFLQKQKQNHRDCAGHQNSQA